MRHVLLFLFFISTATLFSKNQTTHIANLNLDTHSGSMQSLCLLLTSDNKKLITRSDKNIDIWNAENLKHLGRIKNTRRGWGCDLHKNDRYFLVHDLNAVSLYDLQTLKHVKDFEKPNRTYSDSLMTASFSTDGKYIYTYENNTVEPRLRKPFLFSYDIASGKRAEIKAFPLQMNSNQLKGDKLYTYNNNTVNVYDIKTDKQNKGNATDKQTFHSLYTWGDCSKDVIQTKICQIYNGIKYSLADGNLRRTELNTSRKTEPKITFIQRKPLRKAYFYETEFKYPYLINKSTQQYYGWDISKGEQIWSIRRKVTVSTEDDSVPSSGMYFFKNQDRALVITGFTDNILDFNIKTGHFRYLPKYKDIAAYHSISLSKDNKVLSLTATEQKKPYPLKTHYFEVDSWKKLQNYDPLDFKAASTEHPAYYTASYNSNDFILFKRDHNVKLATFHNFVNGEWLVMTPQGYFNASSYNVLVNILKNNKQESTLENMQVLAKKWYRPDIVEAILTEKDFSKLKNKTSHFTLPRKAVDNNVFKESLKAMIREDKRLDLLRLFERNLQKEDLPFIFRGIENAQTEEIYSAYYRTLLFYHFRRYKLKAFIESRIKSLSAHPLEQAPLLRYIYAKHGPKKKTAYILDIVKNTELTDEAKMVIAKRAKSDTFKTLEPLLWEVWEKQFYVSSNVSLYLKDMDPQRAKKAQENAELHHIDRVLASIPKVYEAVKETKKFTKERSQAATELLGLYKTLNDLNTSADVSVPKEIAMANLDAFLHQTDLNPYEPAPYLHFIMKYGSEMEKKILHTKIEIYILSFYKESKKHNTYALGTLLKDYFPYKPEFVLTAMNKLTKSPIRSVRSNMAYTMRNFRDPKFVPYLLKMLDFKDEMVSNSALSTLLQYDANVIKQVIPKLNALKTCSKIHYLDISNSTIARKVDKATYATYRCGN